MLASAPAGDPDRLTVQLPPASLDATARLLGDYAARWGFPADAVTDWHTSAAQRASGDSYYGTQVFTPPRDRTRAPGVPGLSPRARTHLRRHSPALLARSGPLTAESMPGLTGWPA
jgi:hypothetical protein